MRIPRKIGIDLDGVLIDHRAHKLALALEYGIALEPRQANANVIGNRIPDEYHEQMKTLLYTNLTVTAPPVKGCIDALGRIKAELYIVSARRPTTIRFAQDWLVSHRIYDVVPAERIFFCGTDEEKRGYCDRLNLEMFLDDKVSVLDALPGKTRRVLFDEDGMAEYFKVRDRMLVATTWDEFIALTQGREIIYPPVAVPEFEPASDGESNVETVHADDQVQEPLLEMSD